MKDLQLVKHEDLFSHQRDLLKKKAKNGVQFLRFPRAGSTITQHILEHHIPGFINLSCSAFTNLPFSWGQSHHSQVRSNLLLEPLTPEFEKALKNTSSTLDQDKHHLFIDGWSLDSRRPGLPSHGHDYIDDFNLRTDKKPGYDTNKLTIQLVRNPYDWLISVYNWDFMETRKILDLNTFGKYINFLFSNTTHLDPTSTLTTLERAITNPFPCPMMKRCFFQGFDDSDNCHVDVYMRYEQLDNAIKYILGLTDCKIDQGVIKEFRIKYSTKKTNGGLLYKGKPARHLKRTLTSHVPGQLTKDHKNNPELILSTFNKYKHYYYDKKLTRLIKNAYSWDLKNFSYGFEETPYVLEESSVLINRSRL